MSLKLAIAAQLPMIAVSTRDTLNFHAVLGELTSKKPEAFNPNTIIQAEKLYTWVWKPKIELPLLELYEKLVAMESTLIIVNAPKAIEPMFDAGEAPVPKTLMHRFMMEVVGDDAKAIELMRGLGGCTIKEAAEFARLTMARDNSLTLPGVVLTRKSSFQGSNGLTHVDTAQDYYEPAAQLAEWVAKEKPFFLNGGDHRLIPRGLLFDGPPGVGKTAGAKWLAAQLGVPLYRMDIGGAKGKYVGTSETNLLNNLARLDQEEPCVALLDEIEKIFGGIGDNDGGTTTTMLSQLLWWLAERRSRVLVVMTTNAARKLPRELYREGRIDKTMWFGGLDFSQARPFVANVLATFNVDAPPADIGKIVQQTMIASKIPESTPETVSHAALTEAAYEYVKGLHLAGSARE